MRNFSLLDAMCREEGEEGLQSGMRLQRGSDALPSSCALAALAHRIDTQDQREAMNVHTDFFPLRVRG